MTEIIFTKELKEDIKNYIFKEFKHINEIQSAIGTTEMIKGPASLNYITEQETLIKERKRILKELKIQ